jgi:DNA repair exonuclease SbcCD nuclease subunit
MKSESEASRVGRSENLRFLFLADSHLGFDLPQRPRVERRRRGEDFFENYRKSLAPAFAGEVDCVIHGGDLFYRSRIPQQLVFRAFEPLHQIADQGTPVLLVPGNHERGVIPFPILTAHSNIHIFDRPKTVIVGSEGRRVGIAGFPQVRHRIRDYFRERLEQTGWREAQASAFLLCLHQTVEGATVGPAEFVFRRGSDVIPGRQIPLGLLGVLSGHIHRAQILIRDLGGRPLAAPVLYPGSTERTSFAEKDEVKGFLTFEIKMETGPSGGAFLANIVFHHLPSRPMRIVRVSAPDQARNQLRRAFASLPPDAVVQVRAQGSPGEYSWLTSAWVRQHVGRGMSVSLQFPRRR